MNRLLLSFLVAGTALGGSAFKNVESHTTVKSGNALPAGYFVQKGNNSYSYVSTTTHGDGICSPANSRSCAYIVPANNSLPPTPDTYTKEQLVAEYGLSPANSQVGIWQAEPER
ncbi:hypothetical protein OQY15_04605 [Pedobacter sp. MC2016-15]|uniref:hypothetical protein n=1 Tax=Pedobacter sp. MC2016-15 TaxID=2994473 RepID=UPI0022475514|nr:hypothetical protein [Pedobacter sp. MC2016-15]MCX2478358.1 hypothetical protein [Pedobacter sp. MC2016-15]